MHFLLLILRTVLAWIAPARRDSLGLAARADGRSEHLPTRPGLWDRWLSCLESSARPRSRALEMRAPLASRPRSGRVAGGTGD